MSSIRRRNGKWQVQIRTTGHQPISRTFLRKADAINWATQCEAQIQRTGLESNFEVLRRISLHDLIKRYRDTIVIHKRCGTNEKISLNAILRQSFTRKSLATLSPQDFAEYRDRRLKQVRPATINREFTILSHVFSVARAEWNIPVRHILRTVRRPKPDAGRNRRLLDEEWKALRTAAEKCLNTSVFPAVEFALETAMRRSELLAIQWDHVGWDSRTLSIPTTKTGVPRTIPLSQTAIHILQRQLAANASRPFPLTTNAINMAWKRLLKRAEVKDLHFHDLRHEAISRFFEMGLSVPEVALISGHKDYGMLARYTHLKADDIAAKL